MMNRTLAALALKVEAETETISRGEPCPRCKVAWLGRVVGPGEYVGDGRTIRYELNHLPQCGHLRDAAIVDRAILADEVA